MRHVSELDTDPASSVRTTGGGEEGDGEACAQAQMGMRGDMESG